MPSRPNLTSVSQWMWMWCPPTMARTRVEKLALALVCECSIWSERRPDRPIYGASSNISLSLSGRSRTALVGIRADASEDYHPVQERPRLSNPYPCHPHPRRLCHLQGRPYRGIIGSRLAGQTRISMSFSSIIPAVRPQHHR